MKRKNYYQSAFGSAYPKYKIAVVEILVTTWQELKVTFWLYYFMALERITGSSKEKEKHSSVGIGLS
jgi:hypothetical protein